MEKKKNKSTNGNTSSTTDFNNADFNIKQIIFSFLTPSEQIEIYWSTRSKSLRENRNSKSNLNPPTPSPIKIKSVNKCTSYNLDGNVEGMLELNNGTIACWTKKKIHLLRYDINDNTVELIRCIALKSDLRYSTSVPIHSNEHIVFTDGHGELRIFDKDLKLIGTFSESSTVSSLCSISSKSCSIEGFAVGFDNRTIKIYTKKENSIKYKFYKELKHHFCSVYCLLYLPKFDILISGSRDKTINILNLSEKGQKSTILTDHLEMVTGLISLCNDNFASGSNDGTVKIWSIVKDTTNFGGFANSVNFCCKCIKTVTAYWRFYHVFLNNLGNDFMVTRQYSTGEFSIWNVKTYESLFTCKESTDIKRLIVTRNNSYIFTGTDNKKLNIWKICQ